MKTGLLLILLFICLKLQVVAADTSAAADQETQGPTPERLAELVKSTTKRTSIKLEDYLAKVAASNLGYASQRYNVTIADAAIMASRVFQNPVIQVGNMMDITNGGNQRLPGYYNGFVTQTFELGGKRRIRYLVARKNYAATASTLQSFLQNLRLDASAAYADAIAMGQVAAQFQRTATLLRELLQAQQERQKAGDISDVDLLQTRVEVRQFEAELLAAQSQATSAELGLNAFLGPQFSGTHWQPVGTLDVTPHSTDLFKLLSSAIKNRPDLIAMRYQRDAAKENINLEKAKRVPDVNVGVGWTNSTYSGNNTSPQPNYNMVGLQFSLPLPIWNRNKAGIASSEAMASQAQLDLENAEVKAGVDVRQALSLYGMARERVDLYKAGVLKDVDSALEKRVVSYKRGGSSLLELLDAQRKANEVWMSFYTAQSDHARAVIELHRAAGIWIIHF
ncbi:TolC family protein [Prosthecobacter vanneervenii]|uniref:Cobalt-zinc-cadmium efflux system outer membrane protein n=1 Tax=Prosthecobacter vanneervenii TaxID=48466 RepID=A0A7W7YDZ3_9BACT|nr:TolC family protein [Prosthecobacter vanneervenii]MBB5034435.1 cobalt-zinc-cadmium efflux system outer membrane protein [Prosthecobacter vanneervenii]